MGKGSLNGGDRVRIVDEGNKEVIHFYVERAQLCSDFGGNLKAPDVFWPPIDTLKGVKKLKMAEIEAKVGRLFYFCSKDDMQIFGNSGQFFGKDRVQRVKDIKDRSSIGSKALREWPRALKNVNFKQSKIIIFSLFKLFLGR